MMEYDGIKKKDVEKRQSLQGEIKCYKLSDEELAKVREETGWNRDEFNKEIYVQRRQEGKTDRQIMKEYNLYPKKLTNLKHEWGLIGIKQEEFLEKQKQEELDREKEGQKGEGSLPNAIGELQLRIKELEEFEVQSAERICNLETDNASLIEELEHYKSTLAKERDEASSEYERLLKKNSELAEIVKDLKENIAILEGDIEERRGVIASYTDGMSSRQTEIEQLRDELKQTRTELDDLKGIHNVSIEQRESLQSQLEQSNSKSCQYCESLKSEYNTLWVLSIERQGRIEELEKEVKWLRNELNEADEQVCGNRKYKRLWESTAFALKEMIDVELFGGDEDARD